MTDVKLVLDGSDLHSAVMDPLSGSMSFLNEVMIRYPDAISFAPGAPHLSQMSEVDIARCIERYVDEMARNEGIPATTVRRRLYEYGPSQGLIGDVIAGALRREYGIVADAADVVVTVGAQEAIFLVLRALRRDSDDMLAVASPAYVGVTGAARLLDMRVVAIPETADGINLDRLARECVTVRRSGRRIRALYVAPDFANPSGTRLGLSTRHQLLALADEHDLLIIEDTAYGFTAAPHDDLPCLKALDRGGRVVLVGTFAKICLPGARVGYLVADQPVRLETGIVRPLAKAVAELKSMVTVNTSPICQALVAGMLLEHGGSLALQGRRRAGLYRRNLGLLLDALDRCLPDADAHRIRWNRPAGGFFVRMHLPLTADVALLERCATTHGILWTPMAPFHLDGTGRNEIRLSCSYLDPPSIAEGVDRLSDFLRQLTDDDSAGPARSDSR